MPLPTSGRRLRVVAILLGALACGSSDDPRGEGGADVLASAAADDEASRCAEQLAPLREELAWADESTTFPRFPLMQLASVSQWRRTDVPEHVVGLSMGELRMPDATLKSLSRGAAETDLDPASAAARDLSLQGQVNRALQQALAKPDGTALALGVDQEEPWVFVRPVLRTLAERDGVVRLVVGMPAPPWWDTRLFDELAQGTSGLGEIAMRLNVRADEVFADCPTAAAFHAYQMESGRMVGYVDAIEACDCRVDPVRTRALLHAIATPLITTMGVIEIPVITQGEGVPFEAERDTPWSAVLPRLLAARTPVLLPEPVIPETPYVPPPPPPPTRRRR